MGSTASLARQKGDLRPKAGSADPSSIPETYWEHAKSPKNCLFLLLPMVILYEIGTKIYATDVHHNTETRILAFDRLMEWLNILAQRFDKSYRLIPVWTIPTILLISHLARKDRWNWKPNFTVIGCMMLEGIALCLPLFLMDAFFKTYVPLIGRGIESNGGYKELLVLCVGAGLYEELLFRMLALGLTSIILMDLLQLKSVWTTRVIVVLSAMAFAMYHYRVWGGTESFSYQTLAFRTGAGIYFGTLFFKRGFGVTCFTHASYDILAVLHTVFSLR